MSQLDPQLAALAESCGLLTEYLDVKKQRQQATNESVLAVLKVLGIDLRVPEEAPQWLREHRQARAARGIEPVLVAWEGKLDSFVLTLPRTHGGSSIQAAVIPEHVAAEHDGAAATAQAGPIMFEQHWSPDQLVPVGDLETEEGRYRQFRLKFAETLPHGYFRIHLNAGGAEFNALVISAPGEAFTQPAAEKQFGVFLPLYALRTQRDWGTGDFTDLEHFARWTASCGGRVVGTLPLLASYLREPCDPSPYAPVSRMFWNELYLDVEQLAHQQDCSEVLEQLGSQSLQRELARLRSQPMVAYREVMELKRGLLEQLSADFFSCRPATYASFQQYVQERSLLEDYAAFRAVHERQKQTWQNWPERLREGQIQPGDYDPAARQYHMYVQWAAAQQLSHLMQHAPEDSARLYLDLPVGVRTDGYDAWRFRSVYCTGAHMGAPPDALFTKGQDWGFPPLHPQAIREDGYRHVRDFLHHHMQLSRLMRIDHVMGLHRAFWIPEGMPAKAGVYVRYQADELYAILCLESHRHQTAIIGENLGTVPPEVNRDMDRHRLGRMYVVQYEMQEDNDTLLAEPPAASVASLNTHDMPTFSAFVHGDDITDRQDLGLLDDEEMKIEHQQRREMVLQLAALLRQEKALREDGADDAALLAALFRRLAASDAALVLVNLEDLWQEKKPQNVPGTCFERPNWQRKAARGLEAFQNDSRVLQLLKQAQRPQQPDEHDD